VAEKQEEREVTGAFAGGAIVLLAAGAALSLRWFRRLL
jgi:Ca-activated chloride channel homolog